MFQSLLTVTPRGGDILAARRGQVLALLTSILILLSLVLISISLFTGERLEILGGNIAMTVIFTVIYAINRSGRLRIAVTILLLGLTLAPTSFALLIGSPVPAVFFLGTTVGIAAAFGRPRTPILWAMGLSCVPVIINLLLYQSPLPPAEPLLKPNGTPLMPLLNLELIGIVILWMVAGAAYLSTRLLHQAIVESRAATAQVQGAQQALITQQDDLAEQNEELRRAHERLEALVEALAVPVIPLADGIGLLPLVGPLDAARMATVEHTTLRFAAERRLRALVIDLSGTKGLDTSGAHALVRLCAALRLLGIAPMLAGLGPQGALLLSAAQIALPPTAATVQDALATLQADKTMKTQM